MDMLVLTVIMLLVIGGIAAVWHRCCRHYWLASVGATVSGAAAWAGIAVLLILRFDPFFTGWGEAARFFVRTLPFSAVWTFPVALLVGLPYLRARRIQRAEAEKHQMIWNVGRIQESSSSTTKEGRTTPVQPTRDSAARG